MTAPRFLLPVATAIAAVAFLAAPAAAPAQLVFDHGNDIWAAADDGSGAHPLVQAAPLGMDAGLGSPAVAPDGETLLFVGTTERNRTAGISQNFYGENAAGTYELAGGVVRRLSGPPTPSPSAWTTLDDEAEPAPGGTYVYKYRSCTETPVLIGGVFIWNPFCKNELRSSTLAAGAAGSTSFATPCDSDGEEGPADPSPDPASGSLLVAYVGCTTEEGGIVPALILSGPGEAGETVLVEGAELSNGTEFADPSWSPDGSRLVFYDHGGTTLGGEPEGPPGIYVVEPVPNPTVLRLLVAAPEEAGGEFETLASPRFVGAGTIAFVVGGSVWSAPTSCDECTLSSPGVKQLVTGGPSPAEQAFSVTWTSHEVAPASVYPSHGGGPAPTPPAPAPPGPAPKHERRRKGHGARLKLTIARVHAPRLRKLLAKGLPVKARCSRTCRLALTLRKKSGKRWKVVGRAKARLRAHKLTKVRVRFTHKARRALRHARRLKLRLGGVARAKGLAPARASRTVKVKR